MAGTRRLEPLPIPSGPAVLALLPRLRNALAGSGPALLPIPAADSAEANRMTSTLLGDQLVADTTALVVGTSGSTGEVKGVQLSAEAILASANAAHARLGGPGYWLLAMSARYIGGLQVLVRSLISGKNPEVVDLTNGFRVDTFVTAAYKALSNSGPHYTALVPTQLSRLITEDTGIQALCAFDAILLGGSATSTALFDQARDLNINVVRTYGMSETGGGCVYEGLPLDGVQVRLSEVDNGVDRIELAGPMLAQGYRLQPEETANAFCDGWFRTADLGTLSPDGHLEVLGRIDDMINTGGVKVAPNLVARVLTALPSVEEAYVVGIPDPEWGQRVAAAIVPKDPNNPPDQDLLRRTVREQLGRAATPRKFVFLPTLPLLKSGKVNRKAIQNLFSR